MVQMNNEHDKKKEYWKLWDVVFNSGIFSFIKDSQDAQNDDKKFKRMLLQILFGIIFTVFLFVMAFWIIKQ